MHTPLSGRRLFFFLAGAPTQKKRKKGPRGNFSIYPLWTTKLFYPPQTQGVGPLENSTKKRAPLPPFKEHAPRRLNTPKFPVSWFKPPKGVWWVLGRSFFGCGKLGSCFSHWCQETGVCVYTVPGKMWV